MAKKPVSSTMLKLAVLSVALQDIGGGAAAPALAYILKAFPYITSTTIMLIITIPNVITIAVSPIYGKLTEYIRKRTLMVFSFACFIIGGTLPAFLNNLYLILVMRAILGVGMGIVLPMAVGLIADFFDGHERDTMNGLNMTVAAVGGIIYQTMGGFLANINWHYCFFAYLFALIPMVFAFVVLPEPEKKKAQAGGKVKLPIKTYSVCLGYLVYTIFLMGLVTNLSVLIVGENLGDAGRAGIALSLFTLGSLLAGFVFGRIVNGLKGLTMSLGYLLTAAGMFVCFFAVNLWIVFAGTFIAGWGMGITIPAYYSRISAVTPPPAVALGLSFVVAAQGLGNLLQPYTFDIILKALGQSIGRPAYAISAVALLGLTGFLASASLRTKPQFLRQKVRLIK